MMMVMLPERKAEGALNKAMTVKRYAHHMVPTTKVMPRASRALNRMNGLGWWRRRWSMVREGPSALRCWMRGWGTWWYKGMRVSSHHEHRPPLRQQSGQPT